MYSSAPVRCLRPLTRAIAIAIAICTFLFVQIAPATDYPTIVDDPPLSPQEQLKKFHLPPGFEIQLVAAEPDVHKPMNFKFDAAGRLWVTGSVEYPYPKAANAKGRDTLRIIHGFNPDGSATKITTFADDLNIPIGVSPISTHEAVVFSIPNDLSAHRHRRRWLRRKTRNRLRPVRPTRYAWPQQLLHVRDRRLDLRLPRLRQQQPRARHRRPGDPARMGATSIASAPMARTSSTSRTAR